MLSLVPRSNMVVGHWRTYPSFTKFSTSSIKYLTKLIIPLFSRTHTHPPMTPCVIIIINVHNFSFANVATHTTLRPTLKWFYEPIEYMDGWMDVWMNFSDILCKHVKNTCVTIFCTYIIIHTYIYVCVYDCNLSHNTECVCILS